MSERDLLQGLPLFLFATAATVSFALAVYLAFYDRKGASAILAAAALVAALLAYLPQLDSLSAFAVNVKLRSNLDRADEILAKLRKLTVVNGKIAYTTLAWGNRFETPKAADKQRILDEMDDQLASMDVGNDERAEIRRSYVRFIAFDFYYLFIRSIDYALSRRGKSCRLETLLRRAIKIELQRKNSTSRLRNGAEECWVTPRPSECRLPSLGNTCTTLFL